MISSKKLIAIGLLLFSSTNLNNAAKVNCDPKNRPDVESCDPNEWNPVCGYYSTGCPFSICGTTQSSACYACADANTLYYVDGGECPAGEEVYQCTADMCDPDNGGDFFELDRYFVPSCGIKQSCSGSGDCDKTYNNFCKSCSTKNNVFYQTGPCDSDKTQCAAKRPTSCPSTTAKVCASFTGADGNQHYATVNGGCNACRDKAVDFYLPGACGSPLPNNQTFCLPNTRPKTCTTENNPVCGWSKNSKGGYDHKVIKNSCLACKDSSIVYTTPGPCTMWCDRNPFNTYDCMGNYIPICGTYKQNGVTKKVSLRNNCVGCYYLQFEIESYVEGLCPGDNGILCANNGGMAFQEGAFYPVCGLTTLTCNSASCRKSYADPFTVCDGTNIVKYIPGLCPGDIGVSCDGYRPGQANEGFTYSKVCGYTKQGCTSSSCRANYSDQFKACSNSKVLYFNAGPC